MKIPKRISHLSLLKEPQRLRKIEECIRDIKNYTTPQQKSLGCNCHGREVLFYDDH